LKGVWEKKRPLIDAYAVIQNKIGSLPLLEQASASKSALHRFKAEWRRLVFQRQKKEKQDDAG
jgi:hypothetical protein